MSTKLVQRRLFVGVREYEIVEETVFINTKSWFKQEKLTVDITMLDPEPRIVGSELAFYNPHKGRPIFTMLLNKPNEKEFNRFVDTLKQSISGDDTDSVTVQNVSSETAQSAMARNVYEEPPMFDESAESREQFSAESVNVDRLSEDINMLNTYLTDERYQPLMTALEALKADSKNEEKFQKVLSVLNKLGIYQGSVLTYAPYLIVLVSKFSR